MGSGTSKNVGVQVEGNEKVFFDQTSSIKFDPGLLDKLTDIPSNSSDPSAPSPGRQSTIDAHVQQKLKQELQKLQREEHQIKQQITEALERENLDREKNTTSDSSSSSPLQSSETLLRDLEGIKQKVERHRQRKDLHSWTEVSKSREGIVTCLLANKERPLDCSQYAEAFKRAVSGVEKEFVASLR